MGCCNHCTCGRGRTEVIHGYLHIEGGEVTYCGKQVKRETKRTSDPEKITCPVCIKKV